VAEGAETVEQLDRLEELGCGHVQGFVYSEALPAEQFECLLQSAACARNWGRGMQPLSS